MKDFIKVVLAVVCGVFIAGIIGFFLFFGMLGSLAASSKPILPREGVLKIDMNKFVLGEQTRSADPFGALDPATLLMGGETSSTAVIGIWDGVKQGYDFWQFFWRCLLILYIYKAFDLVFLDWVLLQKTRFFQHYYPETKGCAGYHSYGFNKKSQITKILLFPFISALIAWLCTIAF